MRVHVELPESLDVDGHRTAHARDEIPGRVPYGLDHLTDPPDGADVDLTFRHPLRDPRLAGLARRVRNRLGAHEVVAEVTGMLGADGRARRRADVVFCMDERTGLPAALVPASTPVVSNLIWLASPADLGPLRAALTRRALRGMAAVVAQSRPLAEDLVADWDLDPARVHHVPVGIDTDFFTPQPWCEGTVTVASVGDDPFRDHALLVDAVRRVRAAGTAARLELGTTTPGIELEPEVGVVHRRRMEGAVRAMYGRAGVVALAVTPSRRGSGSTVVLEAAASARPVVATRTPAMEDLVAHGERGLLVDPEDPGAFAAALAELLTDPERAQAMGRAARRWVEEHRTHAHQATALRGALRAALPGHRVRLGRSGDVGP